MSILNPQTEPLAVSQTEAARLLSITPRSIFALRQAGRLTSLKVGTAKKSKVLIPVASIRNLLAQSATPTA